MPGRGKGTQRRKASAATEAPGEFEDVAARAARLGVTAERVLEEYARIAFADVRHVIGWQDGKLTIKDAESLTEADAAPISEISADGRGSGKVRVKLYDKKAALDAIARHLGMFPPAPRRREEDAAPDSAEDLREELVRRLDRLAGPTGTPETEAAAPPPKTEGGEG